MSAPADSPLRALRTTPVPRCPACATGGAALYEKLEDHLFGAPGSWRMVRCGDPGCGLLWLDPAPHPEDLGLAYRRYYTHSSSERSSGRTLGGPWGWIKQGYLAARFGYPLPGASFKRGLAALLAPFPSRRENLDRLVMHLRARPGGRALDVGFGEGLVLETLEQLGWQVEGVDFDPVAVENAARRGLRVRCGTLEDQRYPDGAFDAVTASHLLEHVPDPAALLRECHRVLRPGGTFVALTPNARSLGHRRFGPAWRGLEPPRHLQVFTAPALDRLAERAGFHPRRLRSTARMGAFIHAESEWISRGGAGSRGSRLAGLRFQLVERWSLRHDPWAGEELVLVATRS